MELVGKEAKIVLDYSDKSINIVAGGQGEIAVKDYGKDNQTNNPYRGNDLEAQGDLIIDG